MALRCGRGAFGDHKQSCRMGITSLTPHTHAAIKTAGPAPLFTGRGWEGSHRSRINIEPGVAPMILHRGSRKACRLFQRASKEFIEHLEPRKLLTAIHGGDTFEFVDAAGV